VHEAASVGKSPHILIEEDSVERAAMIRASILGRIHGGIVTRCPREGPSRCERRLTSVALAAYFAPRARVGSARSLPPWSVNSLKDSEEIRWPTKRSRRSI